MNFSHFLRKYPLRKIKPTLPSPSHNLSGVWGRVYVSAHYAYHYVKRGICYKTVYIANEVRIEMGIILSLEIRKWLQIRTLRRSENQDWEENDKVRIRYQPRGIEFLLKNTQFEKYELKRLYRLFKQINSLGYITEDELANYLAAVFKNGDVSKYARYFFRAFERASPEKITFDEFAIGLSIICRGSLEERVNWLFGMYDDDKDGWVSPIDVFYFLSAVYDLTGSSSMPMYDTATLKEHTRDVFRRFDANRDGVVTRQDFIDVCLRDQTMCEQMLALVAWP